MTDRSRKFLLDLIQQAGNDRCADCNNAEEITWASTNLGVFLCKDCAGVHRSLGTHISKVKSIDLDKWDDDQLKFMESEGNLSAKAKFEQHVPVSYRIPTQSDAKVMKEQWIRGKYERMEFMDPEKQTYMSGMKEGYLWKQGRDDQKFMKRKFVLSESDNSLLYYNKENAKDPKCVMRLEDLNVTFVPEKVGNYNGLQITFEKDTKTRNIFVYAEEGKDIVDWYNAIRAAKLNILKIGFPNAEESQLLKHLTRDFTKEGWLHKTGPKGSGYKKRWFTLDKRRLMYHEAPLDAFPKGEIYIGHKNQHFAIRIGVPPGKADYKFSFTLKTPEREYLFGADEKEECNDWVSKLKEIINIPLTPQDSLDSVRRR